MQVMAPNETASAPRTARAVAPYLIGLGFYGIFTARGPYTGIVRDIPVSVVTEDSFALAGCARYICQVQKCL